MNSPRDDPSDPPVEFGDALQWSEVDEAEEQRRAHDPDHRRRLRLLVSGCVVGGLVIIVVLVFGVRALVSDLDNRQSPRERTVAAIKVKYEKSYDACVSRGGAMTTCSEQAARSCVIDPRWRDDEAEQLTETCVFGPRR